uniref:Cytochrome b5 heme-binding domain-containing protein n=1 Tax=viral metagenome TaxID=1070528 RepID=A0A6C0LSA1_9ZZZZ
MIFISEYLLTYLSISFIGLLIYYYRNYYHQNIMQIEKRQNNIIVYYKGGKYDITNFLTKHPGGKNAIIDFNGEDVEKSMAENKHSTGAYNLLEKYKIN